MIKPIRLFSIGFDNNSELNLIESAEVVRVNDLLALFERFVKEHTEEEGTTMIEYRGRFSEAEREFLLALANSI